MKRLTFIISIFLMTGVCSWGQISSDKWPEAKIKYFELPKTLVNVELMDAELGTFLGIYYGLGVDYRLNDKIWLGVDATLPLLDKSFIHGGDKSKLFSANGELVLSSKRKSESQRIELSRESVGNNMEEITYRDYDIMTPSEKVLRMAVSYYRNPVMPNKFNTDSVMHYYTFDEPAFYNVNGKLNDGVAMEKVLFLSAGFGWKNYYYYFVEMPDLNRTATFATILNPYVDVMYSPSINLVDHEGFNKMPLGFRAGVDASYNRSRLGFYWKMETGILPGVGSLPMYFKIGFGLRFRVEGLKYME